MTKYLERLLTTKEDHIKSSNKERKYPLTGIRNVGNSCYMNAILQSLSNTNQIRNYCHY